MAARLIFDYPTIASVASYASEQLGTAAGATMHVPMAVAGSKKFAWCRWRWFVQKFVKDEHLNTRKIINIMIEVEGNRKYLMKEP